MNLVQTVLVINGLVDIAPLFIPFLSITFAHNTFKGYTVTEEGQSQLLFQIFQFYNATHGVIRLYSGISMNRIKELRYLALVSYMLEFSMFGKLYSMGLMDEVNGSAAMGSLVALILMLLLTRN